MNTPDKGANHPWQVLLGLARLARGVRSAREAGFLLVNETRRLLTYRQAALWLSDDGLYALSGVVQIEANVPYTQWLQQVFEFWRREQLVDTAAEAAAAPAGRVFCALDLPEHLRAEWAQWWPPHALWLSWSDGALLLVRDEAWSEPEQAMAQEWLSIWSHEFSRCRQPAALSLWSRLKSWRTVWHRSDEVRPWWKRPLTLVGAVLVLLLLIPVRLTVLAPAELTPFNPVVIRSPLDGVIDTFHVQPNQFVKKDQLLFGFDEALTQSRLEVATQALATAQAEYRQTLHLAMSDARAKGQMSLLTGKIEEKRAEVDFLSGQLQRARVQAPQEGVVLMDEPSEWIGRPVTVGERILRIAAPGDAEVEAWLALSDAIRLEPGSQVSLYLNASPLDPVAAKVRYVAHDAVQRPDGQYAYRVRAQLTGKTEHRVGLKGTAKLQGDWVPLVYWMFRRPVASVRTYLGL